MFLLSKQHVLQLGLLVAALGISAAVFADLNLSIDKIRSAAFMGSGEPVEISPKDETEKWNYGESDPSQIWLSTNIVSSDSRNLEVSVFLKVKIGVLSFSETKGIDVKKIIATAKWNNEKLLKRDVISAKSGEVIRYQYKFPLDNLIDETFNKNQWPRMLSFRITVKQGNKEVKSKKNIVLTPDNKFDY